MDCHCNGGRDGHYEISLPFSRCFQGKEMPRYVEYLGRTLPYATMGLLVVYCLKGIEILNWPFGLP